MLVRDRQWHAPPSADCYPRVTLWVQVARRFIFSSAFNAEGVAWRLAIFNAWTQPFQGCDIKCIAEAKAKCINSSPGTKVPG